MTKWTKGPWTHDMADHTSPVDDIIIKSSERMGSIGRLWQDDNCGPDQWEFNIEQAANANLIAAAPEMYEALEDILAMIERERPDWHREWLDNAHLVLAKARGEL